MVTNTIIGLTGVLVLGIIGFLVALRQIRRDEARRRANQSKE